MTTNLLDLIKQGLPSDFSDLAGKVVGESPGATQTALTAALPALVGAIAQKGSTTDGARSLLSLLDNPNVGMGGLANLSGLLGGGQDSASLTAAGSGLLGSLLGDKAGALAGTLASVAGLRACSQARANSCKARSTGGSRARSASRVRRRCSIRWAARRRPRWARPVPQWDRLALQSDRQARPLQARRSVPARRRPAPRSARVPQRPMLLAALRGGCAGCHG